MQNLPCLEFLTLNTALPEIQTFIGWPTVFSLEFGDVQDFTELTTALRNPDWLPELMFLVIHEDVVSSYSRAQRSTIYRLCETRDIQISGFPDDDDESEEESEESHNDYESVESEEPEK